MSYVKALVLLSVIFTAALYSEEYERPMVVVIPSYKNEKWCSLNLRTILDQNYSNYRVVYIDDCSPDSNAEKVENFVLDHISRSLQSFKKISFDDRKSKNHSGVTHRFSKAVNKNRAFFSLVVNKNRCGALANLYRGIHSCDDDEIVVTIDGDDWLPDDEVLKRLNEAYGSGEVWLTHGNLIEYPSGSVSWCEDVPSEIVKSNTFRTFKCPSHLRTFYSWLFKKIALKDLLYEGDFFSMTWDMAMMYPMIEMAGERHLFTSHPNYVYNMINPINDNKVNADLQNFLDKYLREKEPYKRLENKFYEY